MKLLNKLKYEQQQAGQRLAECKQQLKKARLLKCGAESDMHRQSELSEQVTQVEE